MSDIPDNVIAFLRERIDSVEQLEMLLLLQKDPGKEWTAEELSRALSTQANSARSRLAEFYLWKLVTMTLGEGGPRYRYGPQIPGLGQTIQDLADCYSKYSVRI